MNEILLIISVIVIYGSVLFAYRFFGTHGLIAVNAVAAVLANIEVLLVIYAFGMEQTLGNVLFAITFLITDILSENEGKKAANRAVFVGVMASILFLILSQMWLLYAPAESDWAMPAFQTIFSNTPRMLLASLSVYAISQIFDVWLYHAWWSFTQARFGNARGFLWLRNNGSTLLSQLLNTALFTVFAFWGTYTMGTLLSIMLSSYVIFIFTSLLDTPMVYLARRMKEKGQTGQLC